MIDETKERLIVMGGTTEPGVFQVEVTCDGSPLTGSILLARVNHSTNTECLDKRAHPFSWEFVDQHAINELKNRIPDLPWGICPCHARRID